MTWPRLEDTLKASLLSLLALCPPVSFISMVSVKHDKSSLLTMSDMKVVTPRGPRASPRGFYHPFVLNYLGIKKSGNEKCM